MLPASDSLVNFGPLISCRLYRILKGWLQESKNMWPERVRRAFGLAVVSRWFLPFGFKASHFRAQLVYTSDWLPAKPTTSLAPRVGPGCGKKLRRFMHSWSTSYCPKPKRDELAWCAQEECPEAESFLASRRAGYSVWSLEKVLHTQDLLTAPQIDRHGDSSLAFSDPLGDFHGGHL